jgi:phosphinothricin acetyltransferase
LSARLRFVEERDAGAVQAIYAPFCESTAISFEFVAPTVAEMARRIDKITERLPWLVCEREGQVVGYVYASQHRERAAYQWSVDVAVYIAAEQRRAGVGRGLYAALFRILVLQGFFKAYAGITLPNPGSVGLHEAVGFKPVGVYRGVGHKRGAWHDVGWWQLALQPEVTQPDAPRDIASIRDADEVQRALAAGAALIGRPISRDATLTGDV